MRVVSNSHCQPALQIGMQTIVHRGRGGGQQDRGAFSEATIAIVQLPGAEWVEQSWLMPKTTTMTLTMVAHSWPGHGTNI